MITPIEMTVYKDGIEYVYKSLKEYMPVLEPSKKLGDRYLRQAIVFITTGNDDIKFHIKTVIMEYIERMDNILDDDTIDLDFIRLKLHEYYNIQEEGINE